MSEQQAVGVGTVSPDGHWQWDGKQWQPFSAGDHQPATPVRKKRSPARDSTILLVLGVVDTTIFPLLVPWVFFLFGLIQARRARGQIGRGKGTTLLVLNGLGLVGYLATCIVAAVMRGDAAWFVTYLLESPLRIFR